ncbi:MAG TPA: hypothetical protein PK794_10390 [Armatimonadota bacterium]|nr:hypothetical protein [Armatimonadota bacterium]
MTDALSRAADGMRLTPDEGLALFAAPLLELGLAADARCRALHPGETRTYVIGRNINYTNICTACWARRCSWQTSPWWACSRPSSTPRASSPG